jgi:hypothetical protein
MNRTALSGVAPLLLAIALGAQQPARGFSDDFEHGLGGWTIAGRGVSIVSSGDPAHGNVMLLSPNGDVHALVRGSDRWRAARIEGDVRFAEKTDSYLGVVYNYQRRGERSDFGLIYLKGDGNYLQANPHHDYNVTRTFYPEYVARLSGASAVEIGKWQHFKVEVVGGAAHFYVGDMDIPRLTFALGASGSGAVGLQPRSVGGDVWVDNVVVTPIERFAYGGVPMPAPVYTPDSLITRWEVAGPFTRTRDSIAQVPRSAAGPWRSFVTDARGGIATAEVVDFHGDRTVAYFRTKIVAPTAGRATLHFSTVDDLALWVNGRFTWFIPRGDAAWFDVGQTTNHVGRKIPVDLDAGENTIVVRVRGGSYAGGGFFVRLER